MEAQQQHQKQTHENGGSGKGSSLLRQRATRWIPTPDHIRILKEIYYNDDIRSPTVDEIKRISDRLSQYGNVKGKNMFYWSQNYKARERLKESLTTIEQVIPTQKELVGNAGWKYPTSSNGVSRMTGPSTTMVVVGHIEICGGYGSETTKQCFRDCSILAGGSASINVGAAGHNLKSVDLPYRSLLERRKQIDLENGEKEVKENKKEVETPKLQSLPLFPMHKGDVNGFCSMKLSAPSDGFDTTLYQTSNDSGFQISLELSLGSYSGKVFNELE